MTTKTDATGTKQTKSRESSQAKQVAEHWSERVTGAMSTAVARTREELEDIWVEARRISSGKD